MPMNKLLFDHQLAAMNAARRGSESENAAAVELLGDRAKQITQWRLANGLSNLGWPHDERQPVSKDG